VLRRYAIPEFDDGMAVSNSELIFGQGNPAMASTSLCCKNLSVKPYLISCNTSNTCVPPFNLDTSHSELTVLQRGETDFFSGEPLRALSTLVFSDNIDLQRSASLTFAEITERGRPDLCVQASGVEVNRNCRCARSRSRYSGAYSLPAAES
jgi:hypothetical protein